MAVAYVLTNPLRFLTRGKSAVLVFCNATCLIAYKQQLMMTLMMTWWWSWLTDINLLCLLIRQMASLVRRALAEVCTIL